MSTLLLVTNPIKRKKGKTMAKRRTSAQVAATRKLVAFNKARKAGTKSVKRKVRKAGTAIATTARRVKRRTSSAVASYRRSNSIATSKGMGIAGLLKQSAVGAVGAIAVDIAYNKLPLPMSMKTGATAPVVKAAVTIGLGMLAAKFANKNLAHGATVGALTVQLRDIMKNVLPASLQGYDDLDGVEYYQPAEQISEYIDGVDDDDGMDAYMSGASGGSYNEQGEYQY